jgi:hypothetical protein
MCYDYITYITYYYYMLYMIYRKGLIVYAHYQGH